MAKAKAKNVVKLLSFDDWTILVVNGKFVTENHSLRARDVLEHVCDLGKFSFEQVYPEFDGDMDEERDRYYDWFNSIKAQHITAE